MRRLLICIFSLIFLAMLGVTSWASLTQPIWQWQGLTRAPDHAWTIATLFDAYFGFLTFYLWVFYKERSALRRVSWLLAIMLLGNMAMAGYVLIKLWQLPPDAEMRQLLT